MIQRTSCLSVVVLLKESIRSLRQESIENQSDSMQRSHQNMSTIWMYSSGSTSTGSCKVWFDPELVGRLPGDSIIGSSDKDALIRILQSQKCDRKTVSEASGVGWRKLEFDKDALLEIAETTLKRKTGARGSVRSWRIS